MTINKFSFTLILRVMVCLIINMACFSAARAACNVTNSAGGVIGPLKTYLPISGSVSFDPSVPVGTVLYKNTGTFGGESGTVVCGGDISTARFYGIGAAETTYKTYPTSVPGVGVRITGICGSGEWWPKACTGPLKPTWKIPQDYASPQITVQLIKTGVISGGGVLTGLAGTATLTEAVTGRPTFVYQEIYFDNFTILPQKPTCGVLTSSVVVPLGDVATSLLKNVGATSDARPFDLKMQCSGGIGGLTTKIWMTMTDATNSSNRSSTLSLSQDSTTSGVGIQILRSNNSVADVVSYGPDSSQIGNLNQFYIDESGNGVVTIPFSARYIRTSSDIKPGSANARATFTMSYQ